MGMFIKVEIGAEVASAADLGRKLVEVCPVDIFAMNNDGSRVEVVGSNEDECVLCDLCIQAAPDGGVRIVKLYEQA